MKEAKDEIIPLEENGGGKPIIGIRAKFPDTPVGQARAAAISKRLLEEITVYRRNIGFGIGLDEQGNIVVEIDDLNSVPTAKRKGRK